MSNFLSNLSKQTSLVIFVVIFALFFIIVGPNFVGPMNLANMARQVAIDAPHVMGQIVVLIAGGLDISVGSVMAMSSALVIGMQEHGIAVAITVALLFGLLVGTVNGLLVSKGKIVPFVATLGTMSVVRGMVLTYTDQKPIVSTNEQFNTIGQGSIFFIPTPMVITLIAMTILWWFLRSTSVGKYLYAVGGNKETAFLSGVPVARTQMTAFMISGFLAALSGVLLAARLQSANAESGIDTPLISIAAAIIGGGSLFGGRGNVVNAFLGISALGLLASGMNLSGVNTYYQIGIRALVLIAVVVIDALMMKSKAQTNKAITERTSEAEKVPILKTTS